MVREEPPPPRSPAQNAGQKSRRGIFGSWSLSRDMSNPASTALNAILELFPFAIVVLGPRGEVEARNARATRMTRLEAIWECRARRLFASCRAFADGKPLRLAVFSLMPAGTAIVVANQPRP